jgi:hypothetical protein
MGRGVAGLTRAILGRATPKRQPMNWRNSKRKKTVTNLAVNGAVSHGHTWRLPAAGRGRVAG